MEFFESDLIDLNSLSIAGHITHTLLTHSTHQT